MAQHMHGLPRMSMLVRFEPPELHMGHPGSSAASDDHRSYNAPAHGCSPLRPSQKPSFEHVGVHLYGHILRANSVTLVYVCAAVVFDVGVDARIGAQPYRCSYATGALSVHEHPPHPH